MSSDPSHPRRLTEADLYRLPDDGLRYELVAGHLVSEPPPGFRHGGVAAQLVARLVLFNASARLGRITSNDTGFVLHRDPDTVRAPDIAFVANERLASAGYTTRCFPGPPDLAVEVLSPRDDPRAMVAKVAEYLSAGTRLVWLVDPEARSVMVYDNLFSPRELSERDLLGGGELLPGFEVLVADLFE